MESSPDYINPYYNRLDRVKFAVKQLRPFDINEKRILSLGGGGSRYLQESLNELNSNALPFEVDFQGDNDLTLNLDTLERLPFEDDSFGFCLLTDILEHLENFHLILKESFRVTETALVISLPIPSNEFIGIIFNRKYSSDGIEGGIYSKFYGLPYKKPEDRHRWWFTYDDVISFFKNFEKNNSCEITFFSDLPRKGFAHTLLKPFIPKRIYSNLFYNAIWIIIKKSK